MLYCDLVVENTTKNRIYAYEMLLQFIYTIVSPKEKHVCWHSMKRCTRLFATMAQHDYRTVAGVDTG